GGGTRPRISFEVCPQTSEPRSHALGRSAMKSGMIRANPQTNPPPTPTTNTTFSHEKRDFPSLGDGRLEAISRAPRIIANGKYAHIRDVVSQLPRMCGPVKSSAEPSGAPRGAYLCSTMYQVASVPAASVVATPKNKFFVSGDSVM